MQKHVIGQKVRYLPQPEWGVGHLLALDEAGARAQVLFPGRDGGPVVVSARGGALVPHALQPGDAVRTARKGRLATVLWEEEGGRGLRRYTFRYEDDGQEDEAPESELLAVPPEPDALQLLKEGRVGDAHAFLLRRQALRLDDERRCDALGALFASRVMVKPHQVGVVQRVLSARRPRFVLADEVGLGKTIEAGMVFSALRLSGLAHRVLVVAPSHLTVQWLVELAHKFNQRFTLMDSERFESSLEEAPGVNPWSRFPRCITSLELLQRNEVMRDAVAEPGAAWDLAIFDEAHHLKAPKAYEAAEAVARASWGLLLLTATPMQLDPAEYHGLLNLIDPRTAPTLEGFEERLRRQEELSAAVRALLEGGKGRDKAVQGLAARFPEDGALRALKGPALLGHLAETYSLSDRLVRNRRAMVGGFSERRLHRHEVKLSAAEKGAREAALAALAESGSVQGAALSNLLRRLESSPAAFAAAVASSKALSSRASDDFRLPETDAKLKAFQGVLAGIWEEERDAKVLVFTEARETLELLQKALSRSGVEALAYHGDLPLVDRDRQVARFRDPEGPKVLLCTEVGGEGRNFQFAHHLVNYDLPWSPATMEQRIGRLDRIGQVHAVDIHVFDVPGTLSADVLQLLADAVGVFGETVGGLDAVLEEVEPRLLELALLSPRERAGYAQELKAKVQAARESVTRAYDPLLDLRSFDREAVEALVARALARLGLEEEEDEGLGLEEGLLAVARDLDERLEETVTELARKVGMGVDTDEQVEAFQCAFHLGHALNVEALPGLDITEERTLLGSFWRDTAVEREESEYFATGHPLVESLFGFLRDGPYGRNGARFVERRGVPAARGVEYLFHLVPPEPEDTGVGARVPSRQLSRFLDRWLVPVTVKEGPGGRAVVDGALDAALEREGTPLRGETLLEAFPSLPDFVDEATAVATQAAEAQLAAAVKRARAAIEAELEAAVRRTKLSLEHQGVPAATVQGALEEGLAHGARLLRALAGVKVVLDSACAFVLNR
jgi:ATP-dependent helicase HepA